MNIRTISFDYLGENGPLDTFIKEIKDMYKAGNLELSDNELRLLKIAYMSGANATANFYMEQYIIHLQKLTKGDA